MTTLDAAQDFDDSEIDTYHALHRIARFARAHGHKAHVTRNARVLLVDAYGAIRSVRTMRAACEWMGY